MAGNTEPGEPNEPLDHSPSSGATDPKDATKDQAEDMEVGRHDYTENKTFAGETIPSVADRDVRWTDDEEIPDKYKRDVETEDGETETYIVSKWENLNQANREITNDDTDTRRNEQRLKQYKQDLETWGSRLELTKHEIERAHFLFEQTSNAERRQHGTDSILLATLTIAANEGYDRRATTPKEIRPQSPMTETDADISNVVEEYTEIRDSLGVDAVDVRVCRDVIRNHI
jgi:hypothetical protein